MHCRFRYYLLFSFILLGCFFSKAQVDFSQTNFRDPLDIPLVLAGTFGELRSNHFHAGIDIKTRGREGFPIIAIEDGYVSRVKTRPGGYGKALYLTHYNGYVSVYAHLQRFENEVADYLKTNQYKNKQFSVDLFPDKESFKVQKGDTIAWSGNSGSSTAPHLHFEIRDAKTQETINPLLFGFKAKDTTPPTYKNLCVYPLNTTSLINGVNDTLRIPVEKLSETKYRLSLKEIIVNGEIGFGVEVYDQLDNAPNKNGVFSIELYVDSALIYKHKMDRFSFSETRYINSLMDYHAKKNYSMRPQKSFKDPNNKLSVYEFMENDGILICDSSQMHTAEYRIYDAQGNHSKLNFQFLSEASTKKVQMKSNYDIKYDKSFVFNDAKIGLKISKYSLYTNSYFDYSSKESNQDFICDIHCVHNEGTPLHKSFSIALAVDSLYEEFVDKAVVCSINKKGKVVCLNTTYEDDSLRASSKTFGKFTAVIDTVAPSIKPIKFESNMSDFTYMSFSIDDTLSGISSYQALVDGAWILMEYDPKNKKLIHYFDEKISAGAHKIELIIDDKVGNENRLNLQFVR